MSNAKNKLVTLLILTNLVIIGIYFMHTGSSTGVFVVTSANKHDGGHRFRNRKEGEKDSGRVHSSTVSMNEVVETPSTVSNTNDDGDDDDDGGDYDEDDSERRTEGFGDRNINESTGYKGLTPGAVEDENYEGPYVYSAAFPDHEKPSTLLKWKPLPDFQKFFQPIDNDQGWVFSAFFEPAYFPDEVNGDGDGAGNERYSRRYSSVRVMVTKLRETKVSTYCHLYTRQKVLIQTVKGKRRSMKDGQGHGTLYAPLYIECWLSNDIVTKPYFVSLTDDPNTDRATNQLKIQYPGPAVRNFTVCFSPLHSNYNFTGQLMEALEFNLLLGAEHFIVYNFSISPQTDEILRHYEAEGLVTIMQWRLPNLEMWYYGQILAVNDCIYRNKGVSRYVVSTDTDEIIVPHRHSSWGKLIADVVRTPSLREDVLSESVLESIKRHTKNIHAESPFGAWSFRCAFYADKRLEIEELQEMRKFQFSLPQKKFLLQFPSRRMLSLKRMDVVYDHGKRSKTVVRPECVDIGSVHIVPKMKPGYQMAYVKADTALLHHYRDFRSMHRYNTLDPSALVFKDLYLERLKNALLKFPRIFPSVAHMG